MSRNIHTKGFTLVEVLIAIVVISILAVIGVTSVTNAQTSAREAKIKADLSQLASAIKLAGTGSKTSFSDKNRSIRQITGNDYTSEDCVSKPNGTNLATLSPTDGCLTKYQTALDKISEASGADVRSLKDPWGRPYYINESIDATCKSTAIGAYNVFFIQKTASNTINSLMFNHNIIKVDSSVTACEGAPVTPVDPPVDPPGTVDPPAPPPVPPPVTPDPTAGCGGGFTWWIGVMPPQEPNACPDYGCNNVWWFGIPPRGCCVYFWGPENSYCKSIGEAV